MKPTCLALFWNVFGTCLALVQHLFCTCLALVRHLFGTCFTLVWHLFDTYLAVAWHLLVTYLAVVWHLFGTWLPRLWHWSGNCLGGGRYLFWFASYGNETSAVLKHRGKMFSGVSSCAMLYAKHGQPCHKYACPSHTDPGWGLWKKSTRGPPRFKRMMYRTEMNRRLNNGTFIQHN